MFSQQTPRRLDAIFQHESRTNLVEVRLELHVLEALLDEGDEGTRWHLLSILLHVALVAERERRVPETCRK